VEPAGRIRARLEGAGLVLQSGEFLKKGTGKNGYRWYADSPGGGPDDWADMGRTGAAGIANFLSPYSDGDYRKQALLHSNVIGEQGTRYGSQPGDSAEKAR
jgi:hypothetical protein